MLRYENQGSFLWYVTRIRGSALERIKVRLIAVFLLSIALTYFVERRWADSPLSMGAISVMGLALGVFLGFRNNTSYDRFWEGRKLWGALVNTARSLARETLVFLGEPSDAPATTREAVAPLQRTQVYRLIAYVHSLRMHLRGEVNVDELGRYLEAEDIATVSSHHNVPNAIALLLADGFRAAAHSRTTSEYRWVELERRVIELTNIQGGCERILSTPIPHSYSILIHRIVALYVFALPFALVGSTHSFTPLVVLIVAYTFLGLDAVGNEIEDPFGKDLNDLPLTTLSRMIEVNLRQMLGETDVPPLLQPVDGFLE